MAPARWNANLHALANLLDQIPATARTALDVGCGEGESTRRLRDRVPVVLGLDEHEPSIAQARSEGGDIDYVLGDLLTTDLPADAFDVVCSVAMLHHLDHRRGLEEMARLVRPGGRILVVGIARSRSLADWTRDAVDWLALRRHPLFAEQWHTPSPKVWPPPLSYGQAREVSLEVLPGATFERVPFRRYALTWTRPPDVNGP